jgi:hypothetical protein
MFADLHNHPSFYRFNRLRQTPVDGTDGFHPWCQVESDAEDRDAGKRGATYTQSDPPKLAKSGTRLVFASLTPIEKGFFGQGVDGSFGLEALSLLAGATPTRAALAWLQEGSKAALGQLLGVVRTPGPVRRLVQGQVMRYPRQRVEFLASPRFDYWEELGLEYEFLKRRDGQREEGSIDSTLGTSDALPVEGAYHLIRDVGQLERVIEGSGDEIAFVMTIEGGHAFSVGPDGERVSEATLFERIEQLRRWEHPVLFLTLAHHFDNGICGHAHSIPDLPSALMTQRRRMGEGFEAQGELGLRVVRSLLALDEGLRDTGQRRILLDVKHMSPRARQEYYAKVVRPYAAAWETWDEERKARFPKIPVIASHAACAGVATLDELIEREGQEDDHWHAPPFIAWGLNFSHEDIRAIHETGGLFGVCFDRRVAGVVKGQQLDARHWSRVVLNHLLGFVDVILLDDGLSKQERARAWDCVCLGTDFDGFIDPIATCPTVLGLPGLFEELRRGLWELRGGRLIEEVGGVDAVLEKIAWGNAMAFARRHLPAGSV